MASRDPFAHLVNRYEEWFLDHRFAYVSALKAVRALLPAGSEGVEIGSGTGRFASPLGIRTGVDPSAAMSDLARKRGVEVTEGMADQLPFPVERFDFALMVAVFGVQENLEPVLREISRVLKTHGTLVLAFLDRDLPLTRACLAGSKDPLYRNARGWSPIDVLLLLERTGFAGFEFRQTIFRPLGKLHEVEPVRDGHGEGAFVAVRARKAGGS